MTLSRRSLLTGLGSLLVVAPAIVRATSIMPVKAMEEWMGDDFLLALDIHAGEWLLFDEGVRYPKTPVLGSKGNPIIGQKAPPGYRWKIVGKWPPGGDAFPA